MNIGAALRRALPIAVAGVVLLTLIELHDGIIRQALRLAGVGLSSPAVLMVDDGCGTRRWMPVLLRGLQENPPPPLRAGCSSDASVLALLPATEEAVLFADGTPTRPPLGFGRLARFHGVPLREGANLLAAVRAGEPLLYPLPVSESRNADASAYMYLVAMSDRARSGADRGAIAMALGVGAGIVVVDAQARQVPAAPHAAASASASASAPAPASASASATARVLELTRDEKGTVVVLAKACLPHGARPGALSGPQWVAETFGAIVVGAPVMASDAAWRRLPSVTVAAAPADAACVPATTSYRVEQAQLALLGQAGFLGAPDERLMLAGFGDSLLSMGRPPDSTQDDRSEWQGRSSGASDVIVMSRGLRGAAASQDARQGKNASNVAPPAGRPLGLFAAFGELRQLLPRAGTATLWALAAAAPVALMLLAARRWRAAGAPPLGQAEPGLIALLAFMTAFAAQPLLLQATAWFIGTLGLSRMFAPSFGPPLAVASDLSAPIALCAVLLVVPILRGAAGLPVRRSHRVLACVSAASALALLVAAAAVQLGLQLLPLAGDTLDPTVQAVLAAPWAWIDPPDLDRLTLALLLLLGAWLALGLILFWTVVYWLFRVSARGAPVAGAAVAAGLLLFLMPMVQGAADLAWVLGADSGALQSAFMPVLVRADPVRGLGVLFSAAFMLLVVVVVLRAFREVAAAMLDAPRSATLQRWARTRWLVLAAVVIVWPMIDRSWAEPKVIHSVAYRLMSFFQAFGALLAVLVPLTAAQALDVKHRVSVGPARFELPPAMLTLLAAAFAGYLTLWNREPLAVALLMSTGWLVFRHLALAPAPAAAALPAAGLASRVVTHLTESRLLLSRKAALEKLFTEGKLGASALHTQRVEIDKLQGRQDADLGMTAAQARLQLFAHGPGSTPLANAARGALAGVVVGAALQLLLPFRFATPAGGKDSGWAALVSKLVFDPQYKVVATAMSDSRLLAFLGELLNALAVWTIAGFIFGYLFHRLRGRDGFMRALVFGACISVPYLLSQALTSPADGVPLESLLRVVPLLVFLLAVGALLFDGATLRGDGVSVAKLPEVYGLKTSVGYVSFAGALAGVQPLLELLGWLSK